MLIVSGITACALYYVSIEFDRYIIPPAWLGTVWNALKDWGVSTSFLTGYVAFVWQFVRSWFVLGILCFGIGISGALRGKRFAVMLAVWLPVVVFISDLVYCLQSDHDALRFVFSFRLRFISLCGIPIGIGAWYLGSLCSRLSTRSSQPPTGASAPLVGGSP